MAVRMSQFGRMIDKDTKGKSMEAQMKKAGGMASTMMKPDKFHKQSLMDKAMLYMLRKKKGAKK